MVITLFLHMADFNSAIETSLHLLAAAQPVVIPTQAGWMLAADATQDAAVQVLLQHAPQATPIILLADERDLLQLVAALDLQVFELYESLAEPAAIIHHGVLGVAGSLLDESGAAPIALVKDEFCFHLLKRFRKPLAAVPLPPAGTDSFFRPARFTQPLATCFSLLNFA